MVFAMQVRRRLKPWCWRGNHFTPLAEGGLCLASNIRSLVERVRNRAQGQLVLLPRTRRSEQAEALRHAAGRRLWSRLFGMDDEP